MQNALVNVNGEILSPDQAKVSVFDRGYIYGDSLYEVARSYRGIFYGLDEHLDRIEKSAELCRIVLAQSREHFKSEIYRTMDAFRKLPGQSQTDAYCRIMVSRGVGKIGFGLNCLLTSSQYVILIQPIEPPTEAQVQKGFNLQVSRRLRNDRRALDPAMKSGNYLNSLLAYLEASAQHFDDALLCNTDGHVTEGTTFNIFYIKRGIVVTPPLDIGILDGITRRHVLEIAKARGLAIREVRFPKERLYEADEVFISSTIKEVFPVTRVDEKIIGGGKPGKTTLQLRKLLQETIDRQISKGKQAN